MLTPDFCRGARAILGWTRDDLAEMSKVATGTVKHYENGKHMPNIDTLQALEDTFEMNGIVFDNSSIKIVETARKHLFGEGWYIKALEDVYYTLKQNPGDFLCMYSDDALSPPEVNDMLRKIRSIDGVKMRSLIKESNTYILGELEEYRYISAQHFQNNVILIYGDKVLLCISNNNEGLLLKEPELNTTLKGTFENLWSIGKKPERTNAKERF